MRKYRELENATKQRISQRLKNRTLSDSLLLRIIRNVR